MDRLSLIKQLICVREEIAFSSTFKVALVLVYLHLLVLGHVTLCHVRALVQIR